MQNVLVNFHFLSNDKSYDRDFFNINTVGEGLPLHANKGTSLLDNCYLVSHVIFGKNAHIDKTSQSDQRNRIT